MSAYIVDRNTIKYLVFAASTYGIYSNGASLKRAEDQELANVGQMLWDECAKSVMYRYEDCKTPQECPGVVDETYLFGPMDVRSLYHVDPLQVIATCQNYAYQSCEHPEWESSNAYKLIESLKSEAIRKIPGMDATVWGAPEPMPSNVISLSRMARGK